MKGKLERAMKKIRDRRGKEGRNKGRRERLLKTGGKEGKVLENGEGKSKEEKKEGGKRRQKVGNKIYCEDKKREEENERLCERRKERKME